MGKDGPTYRPPNKLDAFVTVKFSAGDIKVACPNLPFKKCKELANNRGFVKTVESVVTEAGWEAIREAVDMEEKGEFDYGNNSKT